MPIILYASDLCRILRMFPLSDVELKQTYTQLVKLNHKHIYNEYTKNKSASNEQIKSFAVREIIKNNRFISEKSIRASPFVAKEKIELNFDDSKVIAPPFVAKEIIELNFDDSKVIVPPLEAKEIIELNFDDSKVIVPPLEAKEIIELNFDDSKVIVPPLVAKEIIELNFDDSKVIVPPLVAKEIIELNFDDSKVILPPLVAKEIIELNFDDSKVILPPLEAKEKTTFEGDFVFEPLEKLTNPLEIEVETTAHRFAELLEQKTDSEKKSALENLMQNMKISNNTVSISDVVIDFEHKDCLLLNNETNPMIGSVSENTICKHFEAHYNVVVTDQQRLCSKTYTVDGVVFKIVGKVDGFCGDKLVEFKNRTKKLSGVFRKYEIPQVFSYMDMTGKKKAVLYEKYQTDYSRLKIEFDQTLFNSVLQKLAQFVARFNALDHEKNMCSDDTSFLKNLFKRVQI